MDAFEEREIASMISSLMENKIAQANEHLEKIIEHKNEKRIREIVKAPFELN